MNSKNLLLATDAYKGSHHKLFPPNTDGVRYYLAPRKPLTPENREFVVFGITSFITDYLSSPITTQKIEEARLIWDRFNVGGGQYPFPFKAFESRVGRDLPVNIYGLPEGSVRSDYNKPILMVECLEEDYAFLPGFIETALQRDVWYGSTVATLSRNVRVFLEQMYAETVDPDSFWTIDYRLHDFGGRGVSSADSAGNGGLAHLVNFKGTDTMEAVQRGMELYGSKPDELACSIPAAEHSTVTSWGEGLEAEKASLRHMIETYGGNSPLIAFVSDSYDFKKMVDEGWCDEKMVKLIREKGVMPVVRPDSGDPTEMVLYTLDRLQKTWGSTVNKKGFAVLNGIAVIQGDGMDYNKIVNMYRAVVNAGYSPQNVAVGMGGGLLQKINRDSMSWSMKMYQVRVDGEWRNVQKKPVTQASKNGWDPSAGLDTEEWVTYFLGDPINATYRFPGFVRDFGRIRDRANPGILKENEQCQNNANVRSA